LAIALLSFAAIAYSPTYPFWRRIHPDRRKPRSVSTATTDVARVALRVFDAAGAKWQRRPALDHWRQSGGIAWIDTVTVVGVAAGLVLLITDLRDRRKEFSRKLKVASTAGPPGTFERDSNG
jgi:hypothetical protein